MARRVECRFIRMDVWLVVLALQVMARHCRRFPDFRSENPFVFIPGYDKDEDVALAGQKGYKPSPDILASNVYINGISLEYTESSTSLPASLILPGNFAAGFPIQSSPAPFPYPVATFGGVQGQIRQSIISDPHSRND